MRTRQTRASVSGRDVCQPVPQLPHTCSPSVRKLKLPKRHSARCLRCRMARGAPRHFNAGCLGECMTRVESNNTSPERGRRFAPEPIFMWKG